MLGHKISRRGIEVDRAKIEVVERLNPPTLVKGIRRFLVMQGFIGGLLKISLRLQNRCVVCWSQIENSFLTNNA